MVGKIITIKKIFFVIFVVIFLLLIKLLDKPIKIREIYPLNVNSKVKAEDWYSLTLSTEEIEETSLTIYQTFDKTHKAKKAKTSYYEHEEAIPLANKENDLCNQEENKSDIFKLFEKSNNKNIVNIEQKNNLLPKLKQVDIVSINQENENKYIEQNESVNNNKYYSVQISTSHLESEGKAQGEKIKNKYKKTLGNIGIFLKKTTLNNKIYFYVLAGKYNNYSKAKNLCKKLIQQGQNCIVYFGNLE